MTVRHMFRNVSRITALLTLFVVVYGGCSSEPQWKTLNDTVIKDKNVKIRLRDDIPETGIEPSLQPGQVTTKSALPEVELAAGVTSKMYWGKGVLINWMSMEPGAEIPKETLESERLMIVWKGSREWKETAPLAAQR